MKVTPRQYKLILKDTWIHRFIRKLAKRYGYICIPTDYPLWILKSATTQERIATLDAKQFAYREGDHNGRAAAYREVANELENFGKH